MRERENINSKALQSLAIKDHWIQKTKQNKKPMSLETESVRYSCGYAKKNMKPSYTGPSAGTDLHGSVRLVRDKIMVRLTFQY